MSELNERPTVAEYLSQMIAASGKSQIEIAAACGFEKPNIITMFKQGKSKLPVGRVGAMARALGVDALHLYALVMREYEPETWAELESTVFKQPLLTRNEIEIVELIRSAPVNDPKIETDAQRETLLSFFSSLPEQSTSRSSKLLAAPVPANGANAPSIHLVQRSPVEEPTAVRARNLMQEAEVEEFAAVISVFENAGYRAERSTKKVCEFVAPSGEVLYLVKTTPRAGDDVVLGAHPRLAREKLATLPGVAEVSEAHKFHSNMTAYPKRLNNGDTATAYSWHVRIRGAQALGRFLTAFTGICEP